MQFILSLILLASCSYIGYALGNYYTLRAKFLQDLISFLQMLKSEIGFSKTNLIEVLKTKTNLFNSSFNSFLKGYLNYLQKQQNKNLTTIKKHMQTIYLEDKEYEMVIQFFYNLGKNDVYFELENISHYLLYFTNYLSYAEKQKTKYVGVYSKLGFLAGIFFIILLF